MRLNGSDIALVYAEDFQRPHSDQAFRRGGSQGGSPERSRRITLEKRVGAWDGYSFDDIRKMPFEQHEFDEAPLT